MCNFELIIILMAQNCSRKEHRILPSRLTGHDVTRNILIMQNAIAIGKTEEGTMSLLKATRSQDSVRRATKYDDDNSLSKQLRVKISDNQFDMLSQVAHENRITVSQVVRIIFEEWCESRLVEQ